MSNGGNDKLKMTHHLLLTTYYLPLATYRLILNPISVVFVFTVLTGIFYNLKAEDFTKMREEMVRYQIQARGVTNEKVLRAMRSVPRHLFVPENVRNSAYGDFPLPIGEGQTISQPYIVALMTELLDPDESDRVLEIGTGSGYQAAVLAEIVREVYTIEIIPSLSKEAQATLKKLGYKNVHFKIGDGFLGWEEYAPFDGIIVTCAPPEIPHPLIEQLKEGGRLVIPVGEDFQMLKLVEKRKGKIVVKDSIPVRFVPMTGIAEGDVLLPKPSYKGKVSVEEAISKRRSVRNYSPRPLSLKDISQLLWAAGGRRDVDAVTSASRTFPSAGARYPVNIYLIAGNVKGIPPGLYRYNWEKHKLNLLEEGDLREALSSSCWGQDMLKKAPATIAFTAIESKIQEHYGKRGERYTYMDLGHAGQNIYLQATALGIGTVAVGAFSDEKLKSLIGVKTEIPIYLFPVGYIK